MREVRPRKRTRSEVLRELWELSGGINDVLSRTEKTGIGVVAALFVLTWSVTIYLFFLFVGQGYHSRSFGFAIGFISFLELLAFSFAAMPFFPSVRQRTVAALYPVVGIIIGAYVVRAMIISAITHAVPFFNSPGAHVASIMFGILPCAFLLGTMLVLNSYQSSQNETIVRERANLVKLAAGVTEIYQQFVNNRPRLVEPDYIGIEPQLKKLKERFQFCTPFDRITPDNPEIGAEIQKQIASLEQSVRALPSAPKEELNSLTHSIQQTTRQILQAMERREKLLVRL